LKQITDVESALHDFERRMRELQRVVQGLSKDVETYGDLIRPLCEIAGAFLGSTPL
jgi:type II secretory pathway component PulJ